MAAPAHATDATQTPERTQRMETAPGRLHMSDTIKKRSRFEGPKRSLAQIPLGHHAIYKGAKSHALDLIHPQAAFLPIFEPRFAPRGLTVNKPQR